MARKSKTLYVAGAIALVGTMALPGFAIDKTDSVRKGNSRVETTVDAHGYDDYRARFSAGQTANVVVSGDGSSDLDLFVFNGNGQQICSDEDGTDDMICSWRAQGGNYTIRIRNLGGDNRYVMEYN